MIAASSKTTHSSSLLLTIRECVPLGSAPLDPDTSATPQATPTMNMAWLPYWNAFDEVAEQYTPAPNRGPALEPALLVLKPVLMMLQMQQLELEHGFPLNEQPSLL